MEGGTPARGGFNFSTFFIKNPVTTLILTLILVVLGLSCYFQMPLELMPNIEFPVVVVATAYLGAAPAEIETLVTKPIEDAVSGLNGIDTLSSTSRDGLSTVVVQLQLGISAKDAENDIRDKVGAILYKLPKDARPPNYLTFSSSDMPIVYYTIAGPNSDVALSTYMADVVEPRLEQVPGVATIQDTGNAERTVEVALDPDRLASYNLSLPGVFSTIQAENYNLPGGMFDVKPRQLSVRTMGKFQSADNLSLLPIPTSNGSFVQLKDLGTVRDTIKDRTTWAALDGQAAIVFAILKQTDANVVEVVKQVDQELAKLKPNLPPGVSITKASDTSKFIKMSNESVWEHLAIGAVLAVLVLVGFLRSVRTMLIAGLAIPLSIAMAFTPMRLWGFTFNNLTMMALSLVVGILVDDAVVDLENIYRHMENGEPPIKAAINATGEIQLAVTATTMTIVGVFLPMSFMTGMVGRFFNAFGLTVTFAVLFSLLIARTLTPMLASRILRVKAKASSQMHPEGDLSGRYPRLLGWCLGGKWAWHRLVVLLIAMVAFLAGLIPLSFVPKSFMSNADRGEFYVRVQLPRGTPIEQTAAAADAIARKVKDYPGVIHVVTTIGAGGTTPDSARLDVLLVDKSQRKQSDEQMARQIRDDFSHLSGLRLMADAPSMAGPAQKPVDVQLMGDNLDELRVYSDRLKSLLAGYPGVADIETSLEDERSELRIFPDRVHMAQLGVSAMQLASSLRLATTGDTPNTMSAGRDEVDVWVRLDERHRSSLTSLSGLRIQTPRGPVPLSALARLEITGGYSQIEHRSRLRLVHVSANLMPGTSLGTATDYITNKLIPKLMLPSSVTVDQQGQARQQRDVFSGFFQAMALGVMLIYFILALQFSSFLHPLTIMFSLPLAVAGAFLGLALGHKDLNMMSLIGIIMLMGIVTKNAILIVDFIITMRERGYERKEAVLRGAQVRLRPILMTTAAMVLGMLPMALGLGSGSEFRSPMAVVVIGGLVTSTGLTLVVVPVVYTVMDDLKSMTKRLLLGTWSRLHRRHSSLPVNAASTSASADDPDLVTEAPPVAR